LDDNCRGEKTSPLLSLPLTLTLSHKERGKITFDNTPFFFRAIKMKLKNAVYTLTGSG